MFYKKLIISYLLYNFINFITLQTQSNPLKKIIVILKSARIFISVYKSATYMQFMYFGKLS
jgi:hypothetical protein